MATINIRSAPGRVCDYCGNSAGVFASTNIDSQRDLCRNCSDPIHTLFYTVSPKPVETNQKNMSLKQRVVGLFLTEPNKSRQATGITDTNNQLTAEGVEVFLNYLLSKNDGSFDTEIVLPLAKSIEAEKK